jgi:hypothetical protein
MEFAVRTVLIGIGATVLMDLWGLVLRRGFGVASLDYALVGRWVGHMRSGRFAHSSIRTAPGIPGERVLGWITHYASGVMFAGVLVAGYGVEWARQPSPGPALAVGLATIVAPFFVMQPGMGLGIAASRTPKPNVARLRSVATHTVFGLGLYASAFALAWLMPL